MANERAALFDDEFFQFFLDEVVKGSRKPAEDLVVFLLSFRAGLRVQEIAGLEWDRHVLDVTGEFRSGKHETVTKSGRKSYVEIPYIQITSDIGKHNNERSLEMHVDLEKALGKLLEINGPDGYVIPSRYSVGLDLPKDVRLKKRADALRNRMKRIYKRILKDKAVGHSSHFGRRNFITEMTRIAPEFGYTLFDVQNMAGHKDPATTQLYVAPSRGRAFAMRGA